MTSSTGGRPRLPEPDGAGFRHGRGRGQPAWVRHYWWAVLAAGIALTVIGVLTQRDLWSIGGPFALGLICTVAGLGGGLQRFRGRGRTGSPS
jgi:hypothetical protein